MQGTVHCGHAVIEQIRGLLRRPAESVAKDQDRPLLGRQVLDGGEVSKLDGFPRDDQHVGPRVVGSNLVQQPVGIGLKRTVYRLLSLRTFQRLQSAGPALEKVEAGVRGDAVEPGPDHGASFEACPAPPRPQQRLLYHVFRLIEGAEHPVAVQVELSPIGLGDAGECRLIAGSHSRNQGGRLLLIRGSDAQTAP